MITCCAADSRSYLVQVVPPGRPPVPDTWWLVTGTYAPGPPAPDGRATVRITPTRITAIDPPADTYELP